MLHSLAGKNVHLAISAATAAAAAERARPTTEAREVFDKMPRRNVVSYNSMIATYGRSGEMGECFRLLSEMMLAGLRPTEFTVGGILAAPPRALLRTALIGVLGRHGSIGGAAEVFREMGHRSTATWNSMMAELSRRGLAEEALRLFRELLRTEMELSESSLMVALSATAGGERLHSLALKSGMDSHLPVANSLLKAYCSGGGGGVRAAERMLWFMAERDAASSGEPVGALRHFSMMGSCDGLLPNGRTLASALSACAELAAPPAGESVHGKAVKLGLQEDDFVASSLVNLYAKFDRLEDACSVFGETPAREQKPTAAWNALLGGFSRRSYAPAGLPPNEFSFSSALRWSSLPELRQLHSLAVKMGFQGHGRVASAAAAAYVDEDAAFDVAGHFMGSSSSSSSSSPVQVPVAVANAVGGILNRRRHFRETVELLSSSSSFFLAEEPDVVTCNILLAAYARGGDHGGALRLFRRMHAAWGAPDDSTAVSLLSVCKSLSSLLLGALLHGLMIKASFQSFDVFAHNALLDMYGKCGSMEGCRRVFEEMSEKNLVSWTAMVAALGLHGAAAAALAAFRRMEEDGFCPDGVAFLAALSACRHGGLPEEGLWLLRRMENCYGVPPAAEHYACVVELLCRSGRVEDAELLISSMPFAPGAAVWRVFLRGCRDLAGTRVAEG
ncbi:unnamed protein product [Spirodela intermedia]|uniref:Uncharacterized protein n=1 Tax=Spirodela intermedia TaxID=51605 RepID=A0A7I8JK21_SPIIN|nr:unnamed protein product [Spirodela intermedia]CAA6670526.1 unnamed protein product [Spirodela intermedia]